MARTIFQSIALFVLSINTYLFQPCLDIERRAGFHRQLVVADDPDIGEAAVEVPHVFREGFPLLRGAGVLGGATVGGDPSGIDDMPGDGVMSGRPRS